MPLIYMTSVKGGATHVYSDAEAVYHENLGWVRAEWPPKPKQVAKPEPVAEAQPEQRKTISLKSK